MDGTQTPAVADGDELDMVDVYFLAQRLRTTPERAAGLIQRLPRGRWLLLRGRGSRISRLRAMGPLAELLTLWRAAGPAPAPATPPRPCCRCCLRRHLRRPRVRR